MTALPVALRRMDPNRDLTAFMLKVASGHIALVLIVVGLGGCGGGSSPKSKSAGTVTATEASTTTEAPTTTDAPTTEATTTTTLGPITQARTNAVIANTFNSVRSQLDSTLRADSATEAVNDISYDQQTSRINIDLASAYQGGATFRSVYDEQAWQIGEGLSGLFWAPVAVKVLQSRGGTVSMLPTLAITLDGLRYVCSPEIENGVATKNVSMEAWLAACRK